MFRKFFFVSVGLLCLALAYQLGVTRAVAQGSGQVAVSAISGATDGLYAITPTGDMYSRGVNFPSNPWSFFRSVSVSSPVVGLEIRPNGTYTNAIFDVFCQDGTVYEFEGSTGAPAVSNVFTGTTPAVHSSWGSIKVQSR